MDIREPIDNFFMKMAYLASERSTCCRRKVGAIITKDNRILSLGYNGAPPGIEHCTTETCLRIKLNIPSGERQELCIGGHAEQNAIANAAENGVAIKGSILYCTTFPCSYCAKAIVRAGIIKVIYCEGYPDEISIKILKNIIVEKHKKF